MSGTKPDMHEMMAKLRAKYMAELTDKLNDLEDITLSISQGAATDDNMLELYRRVHSIKGSAGSYGVPIVSSICHRFEDRINEAQEDIIQGDRPFIDDALTFIDILRDANTALQRGDEDFSAIEAAVDGIVLATPSEGNTTPAQPVSVIVVDSARTTSALLRAAFRDRPEVNLVAMDSNMEALDRLLVESFDVVVCGLGAGQLGGLALITALKLSNGRSRNATTLLVTSDPAAVPATNPAPDQVADRGPSLLVDVIAAVDACAGKADA